MDEPEETPVSRNSYQLPELPEEIEAAYRAAHRAMEGILPKDSSFVSEAGLHDINEVISQFPIMVEKAAMIVAAYLGPEITWKAEAREKEWDLTVAGIDFDAGGERDFGVRLDESAFEGDHGGWSGSSLDLAARVYKREAGWDFPPDEAGIWLLMLAPESGYGGHAEWSYHGYLAGFVILYDRDEDGKYESVGHMWTAHGWRRKGIARRLLQEAKLRFNFSKVEGPLTKDSAALLKAYPEFCPE